MKFSKKLFGFCDGETIDKHNGDVVYVPTREETKHSLFESWWNVLDNMLIAHGKKQKNN